MKKFLLFLPLLAVISLVVSGCWDPGKYRHCVCFDTETHTKVKVTIYDRTCDNETYSRNRRLDYQRWICEKDTTDYSKKNNDD